MVITAPPTRAEWANQLSRNLDNAVQYPQPLFGRPSDAGLVSVVFIADSNGKPMAAKIVFSSRSYELDRAAMAAIKRMKPVFPKPANLADNQRIRANVFFATSNRDFEKQLRLLRLDTAQAAAQPSIGAEVLAINIPAGRGGSAAKIR
jgi:TonB family protein